MEISTTKIEPVKIYHEGKFDRRYWYTLQAKRYLLAKGRVIAHRIDAIFEQQSLHA